jgi:DNA-binding transcriptional LysR family regulator
MNWDDLRFVLALARHRTLNRAAQALGATHTTVARRLRGLESTLGNRLFDATEDGYVATAAGLHVIASAERTEAELLALEARVYGGDAKLEGALRVTTMDILFRQHAAVFASFLARFPGIDLTVLCADTEASLTRREADIALRLSNAPAPHLWGRKVSHVSFAVYASHELAERIGPRAKWSAFPWLHGDERLGASWLDAWLAENAPEATIALRLNVSSLGLREVVAAGLGVHFLACSEGDGDPRLRRIGPVQTAHGHDVWLLTLPELRTSTRVRAFVDHFVAETAPSRSRARPRSRPTARSPTRPNRLGEASAMVERTKR